MKSRAMKSRGKQKRGWKDMEPEQRKTASVLGLVQVALAISAWVDLIRRPADHVNGRKGVWAAVIAINFIGPIAYFTKGRRKD